MRERYSIEVTDEVVEIYGDLTIEEAFDFLSFFERKGYKSLVLGSENSTLRLMKRDQKEEIIDQRITDLKDEVISYKRWLEREQDSHAKTNEKLKDTERLMKTMMSEEYLKYKKLHDDTNVLLRAQCIASMQDNPEVKEIMESFGCDPEGTNIKGKFKLFDWPKMEPIPNCCSTPEKQEQYEKLVQLKNDFPHIPVPSPSDYYINPDPTKE